MATDTVYDGGTAVTDAVGIVLLQVLDAMDITRFVKVAFGTVDGIVVQVLASSGGKVTGGIGGTVTIKTDLTAGLTVTVVGCKANGFGQCAVMHPTTHVTAAVGTVRGTAVAAVFRDIAVDKRIDHGNFKCTSAVVMAVDTIDCLYTKTVGCPGS